jgi:hypothetical protein
MIASGIVSHNNTGVVIVQKGFTEKGRKEKEAKSMAIEDYHTVRRKSSQDLHRLILSWSRHLSRFRASYQLESNQSDSANRSSIPGLFISALLCHRFHNHHPRSLSWPWLCACSTRSCHIPELSHHRYPSCALELPQAVLHLHHLPQPHRPDLEDCCLIRADPSNCCPSSTEAGSGLHSACPWY